MALGISSGSLKIDAACNARSAEVASPGIGFANGKLKERRDAAVPTSRLGISD
jgi:hypothetical protein